jgi:hypothetical protein
LPTGAPRNAIAATTASTICAPTQATAAGSAPASERQRRERERQRLARRPDEFQRAAL